MKLAVIDLDDTLVSKEITRSASVYAYEKGLQKLRESGLNVPEELRTYSFRNLNRIIELYPRFEEAYLSAYEEYLVGRREKLMEEKQRAGKILETLVDIYHIDEFIILTANRAAMKIVKAMGLANNPLLREIIIVPGINYVDEKAKIISNLKEKYERIIYVADCVVNDAEVARRSNVEFLHVKDLLERLYSAGTKPRSLNIQS